MYTQNCSYVYMLHSINIRDVINSSLMYSDTEILSGLALAQQLSAIPIKTKTLTFKMVTTTHHGESWGNFNHTLLWLFWPIHYTDQFILYKSSHGKPMKLTVLLLTPEPNGTTFPLLWKKLSGQPLATFNTQFTIILIMHIQMAGWLKRLKSQKSLLQKS